MGKKYLLSSFIILFNIIYIYLIPNHSVPFFYVVGLIGMALLLMFEKPVYPKLALLVYLFTMIIGFFTPILNLLLVVNTFIVWNILKIINNRFQHKTDQLNDLLRSLSILLILSLTFINYYISYKRFIILYDSRFLFEDSIFIIYKYIIEIIILMAVVIVLLKMINEKMILGSLVILVLPINLIRNPQESTYTLFYREFPGTPHKNIYESIDIPHFFASNGTSQSVLFQKEIFGINNHFTNHYLNELSFGKVRSFILSGNELIETNMIDFISNSQDSIISKNKNLITNQYSISLKTNDNYEYQYDESGHLIHTFIQNHKSLLTMTDLGNGEYLVLSGLHPKVYDHVTPSRYIIDIYDQNGNKRLTHHLWPDEDSQIRNVRLIQVLDETVIIGCLKDSFLMVILNQEGLITNQITIPYEHDYDHHIGFDRGYIFHQSNGHYLLGGHDGDKYVLFEVNLNGEIIWNQTVTQSLQEIPNFYFTEELIVVTSGNLIFEYTAQGDLIQVTDLPMDNRVISYNKEKKEFIIKTKDHFIWMDINKNVKWQYDFESTRSYLFIRPNGNFFIAQMDDEGENTQLTVKEFDQNYHLINEKNTILPFQDIPGEIHYQLYFSEKDHFFFYGNNQLLKLNQELNISYEKTFYVHPRLIKTRTGYVEFNQKLHKQDISEEYVAATIIDLNQPTKEIKIGVNDIYLNEEPNIDQQIKQAILITSMITVFLMTGITSFYFLNKKKASNKQN